MLVIIHRQVIAFADAGKIDKSVKPRGKKQKHKGVIFRPGEAAAVCKGQYHDTADKQYSAHRHGKGVLFLYAVIACRNLFNAPVIEHQRLFFQHIIPAVVGKAAAKKHMPIMAHTVMARYLGKPVPSRE